MLRYCHAHDLAVTARGAGTGNYGQAVPLHGGVVLDLAPMDRIEEIQPDGVAVLRARACASASSKPRRANRMGAALLSLDHREGIGWRISRRRLRRHRFGGARQPARLPDTVRALEVVTMEAEPRVLLHEGEAVHDILHAWGTNGVITRIWLALAPAVEWSQCAVAFDTFDAAFDFSERIAGDPEWTKRLVTPFEWPIPSFFTPVKPYAPEGKALIFFLIAEAQCRGS